MLLHYLNKDKVKMKSDFKTISQHFLEYFKYIIIILHFLIYVHFNPLYKVSQPNNLILLILFILLNIIKSISNLKINNF